MAELYDSVRKNDEKRDALKYKKPDTVTLTPGERAASAGRAASKTVTAKAGGTAKGAVAQSPAKTAPAKTTPARTPQTTSTAAAGRGPRPAGSKPEAASKGTTVAGSVANFITERARGFAENAGKLKTAMSGSGSQGPAKAKAGEFVTIPPNKGDNTKAAPSPAAPAAASSPAAPAQTKAGGGKSGFGSAFAAARKSGAAEFTFNGKKYTTKVKGEGGSNAAKPKSDNSRLRDTGPDSDAGRLNKAAAAKNKKSLGAPRAIHPTTGVGSGPKSARRGGDTWANGNKRVWDGGLGKYVDRGRSGLKRARNR